MPEVKMSWTTEELESVIDECYCAIRWNPVDKHLFFDYLTLSRSLSRTKALSGYINQKQFQEYAKKHPTAFPLVAIAKVSVSSVNVIETCLEEC